jgi:anti-sigma factor RsiW
MPDRYDQDASLPNDDELDEYLCEYVDGTMDPAVRKAFEEFLRANPELEAHVHRLERTRALCTRQSCTHAPSGLQHRLRAEIARDLMGESGPVVYLPRLGHFAVLSSLVALATLIGVVVGASLLDRRVPAGTDTAADRLEQPAVPSDAHARLRADRPASASASMGVAGPVRALPALSESDDVTPIVDRDSLEAALAARSEMLTR